MVVSETRIDWSNGLHGPDRFHRTDGLYGTYRFHRTNWLYGTNRIHRADRIYRTDGLHWPDWICWSNRIYRTYRIYGANRIHWTGERRSYDLWLWLFTGNAWKFISSSHRGCGVSQQRSVKWYNTSYRHSLFNSHNRNVSD